MMITLDVLQSSSQKDTRSVSPQILSMQESFCFDQRRAEQVEFRFRMKVGKNAAFLQG